MKTLNYLALAIVGLLAIWMVSGSIKAEPAGGVKLAYVDFQKLLDESVVGKKAQADLEKKFGPTKALLKSKMEELKQLQNQIEKQKDVLSPIALEEKKNLFEAKYKSYMQQKAMLQEQYNSEFIKLIKPMLDEITAITNALGKERAYTMIYKFDVSAKTGDADLAEMLFFPTAIAYFDPGCDITAEVLKRYDAKHKTTP